MAQKLAILPLLTCFLPACTHMLAQKLVTPPNHWKPIIPITLPADGRKIKVPVGPPNATLAAWSLDPANAQPSRGTILLLHGIMADHSQVRTTAHALANAGYRAVMVDLRGHGQSTGDHISFGVIESRDLVQFTNWLQRHNLCGPTLGVFGISYGASVAIEYAGADPHVSAVVSIAPFASLAQEVPHYGRTLVPIPGLLLSDQDYRQILVAAGRIADFDPAAADPLAAIQRTRAQILLIHGNLDVVSPISDSIQLHDAAPTHSQLHRLNGTGHLVASLDLPGEATTATEAWFRKYLASPSAHVTPTPAPF